MNKIDEGKSGLPEGKTHGEHSLNRVENAIRNFQYWVQAAVLFFPTLGGQMDLPGESRFSGMRIENM